MEKKTGFRGILADIHTYRRAYVLTIIASFGGMLFGWDTGLIGGILTMSSFQQSFALDKTSKNFSNLQGNIVSILQGGCFFGAASSFYLGDRLGRKVALIIASVIFLGGSLIQTCAALNSSSLAQLYVGRFIGGFGVGLVSAVVPTYIGENANKEIRGRCIGTMQLFNTYVLLIFSHAILLTIPVDRTGIMLSYFVNYGIEKNFKGRADLKWRIPFALQMLPGLLLLVGIFSQNESPRWLVEKNRIDDARRALSRVRAKSEQDSSVEHELQEIINDFRGREKMSFIQQARAAFESRKIFYRCSMAIILMFWQQWSGTNSINYYSPQIFASIGVKGTSAGLFATGIYGVVKVVFTLFGLMLATEQIGRKWLLIVGGAGQAFAMFYIGIHSGVVGPAVPNAGLNGSGVFSIVCVYLFVVFYSFGWGPIPFILSAESAPNHVRSLVMALALMTQWLFNFVIAKITPIMLSNITYGTFLLFGVACTFACLYSIFCVPETRNVPLESVYLLFEGSIIKGCVNDVFPSRTRARKLQNHSHDVHNHYTSDNEGDGSIDVENKKDAVHIESSHTSV